MKKLLLLLSIITLQQVQGQTAFGNKTTPLQPMATATLYDSIYSWNQDTSTMLWNLYSRQINFVYDANNNSISNIDQSWNGTSWDNWIKDTSTFDVNNNKINAIGQTWNGTAYVNNSQLIIAYDANNNDTSQFRQVWSSGSWMNTAHWHYTYDVNNNRTSFLYQTWSGTAWVNQSLSTYTYNVGNKVTNQLTQSWTGSAWVNYEQFIFNYNANNYLTSYFVQNWTAGNWVTNYQFVYTYDVNNNVTAILSQSWNGSIMVNSSQNNYTYDVNNLMIAEVTDLFTSNGSKIFQGDSMHYYYKSVTGIKTFPVNNVQVNIFPNPASDQFYIDANTTEKLNVNLYDINGSHVFSKNVNDKSNIDVITLNEGIYTLTIRTGGRVINKKLVILR